MEQVLNAVQIVLSIFTMIGLGMFLVKIGWIKDGEWKNKEFYRTPNGITELDWHPIWASARC